MDDCFTDHRVHPQSVMAKASVQENTSEYKHQIINVDTIRYIYWSMGNQSKYIGDFLSGPAMLYSMNKEKTLAISRVFHSRALHYFRRAEMRNHFLKKFFYAFAEILNCGYFRYSSGFLSFGKDLLGR